MHSPRWSSPASMNKTEPPPPQHKRLPERVLRASTRGMSVHHGIPVSAGVAIGPVFTAAEPELVVTRFAIADGEAAQEMARLEDAITRSRRQLAKLQARLAVLPEDSQGEIGPLIEAYVRMLADSRLIRGARRRIADHARSAEAAVREISRRLVRNLTRAPFRSFAGAPEGAVLVAEVLRPSDAALLDPTRLTGVATEEGGAEGHTAVMLRALGLPAVLGAAGLAHAAKPGDVVIVDGGRGTVTLNPDAAALAAARRAVTAFARERQRFARLRSLPAETSDGEEVELQANMELPLELPLIQQSGAHGIGLLRTEFLFMNRETVPDEDTQTDTYR